MKADLAIVCGIPLTEQEWMERYDQAELGDFVRRNAEGVGRGDPKRTWQLFDNEATFIRRKLESFKRRAVHVSYRAKREDISRATELAANVAVIAHWKHERVFADDIRSATGLREWLVAHGYEIPVSNGPGEETNHLARYLDALVVNGESSLVALSKDEISLGLPATLLRRERINELPDVRAGNRIELWDVMLTPADFCDQFGEDFIGTACMYLCYSRFLAETFSRRYPRAVCLGKGVTTRAGLNLAKLDAALTIMRARRIQLWKASSLADDVIDSLA